MAKTQFLPYEKIREYQFEKLKKLLAHACLNVPYYSRLITDLRAEPQDFRTWQDFKLIPFLTKGIIKNNFEDLIAKNVNKSELIQNATGGSTGEPLSFYQDKNYKLWADAARRRGWYNLADCEYGDTCAVIWGAMHEVKENFSFYERARDLFKTGEVWLNAFNLSNDRKLEFLRICKIVRPKLLRGYTTAIADFARFLEENKLTFPKVKGIILCAETVTDDTQQYIESVLNAPSFNTYGGRELSLIAMQCKYKNGLHEISENNYVEYDPIELEGYEGAGDMVITNLNNYSMPFIRYKNGDIGVPGRKIECGCGRGLPLIHKVVGRTTEVFTFADGTRIAGEMFIHLMKGFPLNEYQFVQVSKYKVILKYIKNSKIDSVLLDEIRNTYAGYLPDSVVLEFDSVDKIDKTKTGKFKFILSDFSDGNLL